MKFILILNLLLFFSFPSFANEEACIERDPVGTKYEMSNPSIVFGEYYFNEEKNPVKAFYNFYQMHLEKGDLSKESRKNRPYLNQNLASARAWIGWMYSEGVCVEKNYKKAAEWYKLGADTTDKITKRNIWLYGNLAQLYLDAKYGINEPELGIKYLSKAFEAKKFDEESFEFDLLVWTIDNIHNLYEKDVEQFLAYSLTLIKYFDFDFPESKKLKENASFDSVMKKNGINKKFYFIKYYLGKELLSGDNTEKDEYIGSKMILNAGRIGKINEAGIYAAEVNEKGLGDYKKNIQYALDWIDWSLKGAKDKKYIAELNTKKDKIIQNLSDKDIENLYGYKNRKSWEFGKKYAISQSYIDEIAKFEVVNDKTLAKAIERGIDEDYLLKSFGQKTKLSEREQGILYQFLVDEKEASDKIFTSALDIKEKRDKENAKKAEEDKKRRAKERAKRLAANPYKIIMSCEHFDSHYNINACLLGDIDSKIKITKGGSSYIYQPWDLQRLGNETYEGLEFNISANSSVGASNVSDILILKIKVYDRITNKLIKTVSAGYLDYAYVKLR